MAERPTVLVSCAVSRDGYLDDDSPERLMLSDDADLDRVDALRATCDAILIGATTLRRDDPRLLVRSEARRRDRVRRGAPPSPLRVVVTRSGDVPPDAAIFRCWPEPPIVMAGTACAPGLRDLLGDSADVRDAGADPTMADVVTALEGLGVRRVMVEGGAEVLEQCFEAGVVDEAYVAVSPRRLGASGRGRLFEDGRIPTSWHGSELVEVVPSGGLSLHRYVRASPLTPG